MASDGSRSSDLPAIPVLAQERGTEGIFLMAAQKVAVALQDQEQPGKLLFDRARIGGRQPGH